MIHTQDLDQPTRRTISKGRFFNNRWFFVLFLVLLPLFQAISIWFFQEKKVDESELVLFAVGFLGGDPDPVWNHYGHLGMYILGAIYYLIGFVAIVAGKFESWVDYAARFIFDGTFYQIGRYICALSLAFSVLLLSKLIDQRASNKWIAPLFAIALILSPWIIFYSNYIRTDTFVAFFAVIVFYIAVSANSVKHIVLMSIFTAAAVAIKISAVTMLGVVGVSALHLFLAKKISFKAMFIVPVVFVVFAQLLSPFMDYHDLVSTLINSERGGVRDLSRIYYSGIEQKIETILSFHLGTLGVWICALALASLIGVFTRYRVVVSYAWLLIFLFLLPYAFGSTLRAYWFVLTYLLLSFLALLTLFILANFILRFLPRKSVFAGNLIAAVSISLLLGFKLFEGARSYVSLVRVSVSESKLSENTNKEIAEKWLIENQFGKRSIFIDRHFSWVYPTIFDPNQVTMSRELSYVFTFEREGNQFLSSVFEHYLYGEYLDKNPKIKAAAQKLYGLRVDFGQGITDLSLPEVCSRYSGKCIKATLVHINDAKIIGQQNASYQFKSDGVDPYVVYSIQLGVSRDFAFYTNIQTDASWWELRYDLGKGYPEGFVPKKHNGSKKVPVTWQDQVFVGKFGKGNKLLKNQLISGEALFVTADGPFNRFAKLKKLDKEHLTDHQKAGLGLLEWHERMASMPLLIEFNEGSGTPIQVYDISELQFDN